MSVIAKILGYIAKHGSKAWNVIKGALGSAWSSFKAAWDQGYWAATKWLLEKSAYVDIIYQALKAAFGE
ncbi:hypothetical protein DNH61_05955 [Paenibacillus sambharensis]|uniref:Uncharacterized protein n=1 Tax=Paenibacillus sambharensis TaxID=1803190 RepID=A0A2W1LFB3_9BACL|nr:hypothetical protein [Paenibacillus sambharensis]PZD96740.1 hypothetical protein DNH61_05955 [Paenibacillus sambharensis]